MGVRDRKIMFKRFLITSVFFISLSQMEVMAGFEPTYADLQSAA